MIIQNAVKILENPNEDIFILSRNTHEYVSYTFKNGSILAVDGGPSYLRRCGDMHTGLYEEWSLEDTDPLETIKEKLVWGTYGKDGKGPFKYVLVKNCENDHLKMILKQSNLGAIYKTVINSILEDRKKLLK